MTLRHRIADSVKAIGPGRDLTNLAFASTLFRLRCELRRPYPTSYYRNWFLPWEAVQLKTQPLSRTFCFPGACDPASIIEEKDRAFTPARVVRASTSHDQCHGWTTSVCAVNSPGFESSWTQKSCWAQLKVA